MPPFKEHPLVYYPEGVATLIDLARQESGGLPVGCSGMGGSINREIAEASDVILIHGNGCTRQKLYNMIREVRSWGLNRPIVCNEDSQAIGQMEVTFQNYVVLGLLQQHDQARAASRLGHHQRRGQVLCPAHGRRHWHRPATAACRRSILLAGIGSRR